MSVVAAALLASATVWMAEPATGAQRVALVMAIAALGLFIIGFGAVAYFAEVVLVADDRVVDSSLGSPHNKRSWDGLMWLVRIQSLMVLAAGGIAAWSLI
ncbi:MAG: hypothetical protein AAGF47_07310 [Planctomycetota bacterium]